LGISRDISGLTSCLSIADLRGALEAPRARGASIGFVPTMGALHDGHLSLVKRARQENDVVAVSIFVNPTQFNEIEDFERYPRDPDRDREIVADAGVDLLFSPDPQEVYPEGFDTVVVVRGLTDILEGAARPGHFQGVATVVAKLLNIAQPTRAYFGRKDYQQLQVIRRLTTDLNLPVEIVACETVREPDGLAMSSRNRRLTPEQREAAGVLSKALRYGQDIADTGVHDAMTIAGWIGGTISAEPLAELDYAVVVAPDNLREVVTIDEGAIALVAARFGEIRLIDNCEIHAQPFRVLGG
jgi:pantoate--beta-alanine ligase